MSDERHRILTMLEEGKLTVREADRLLRALGETGGTDDGAPRGPGKFLRVVVREANQEGGGDKVDIRVPFDLLRAGMKLESLIPDKVKGQVNAQLSEKGIDLDLSKIKGDKVEEFIAALRDLTVDIEGKNGEKVRVFCE